MNIRIDSRASQFTHARKARVSPAWLVRRGAPLALSAVGSIALLGCSRSDGKANAPAPHVVRVVEVDATRAGTYETKHYTGVVRARTESNLGFRVTGKVV